MQLPRYEDFNTKAIREHEQRLRIPRGWWGTYRHFTNGEISVRFVASGRYWLVTQRAWPTYSGPYWRKVSKHDARNGAIRAAKRLVRRR